MARYSAIIFLGLSIAAMSLARADVVSDFPSPGCLAREMALIRAFTGRPLLEEQTAHLRKKKLTARKLRLDGDHRSASVVAWKLTLSKTTLQSARPVIVVPLHADLFPKKTTALKAIKHITDTYAWIQLATEQGYDVVAVPIASAEKNSHLILNAVAASLVGKHVLWAQGVWVGPALDSLSATNAENPKWQAAVLRLTCRNQPTELNNTPSQTASSTTSLPPIFIFDETHLLNDTTHNARITGKRCGFVTSQSIALVDMQRRKKMPVEYFRIEPSDLSAVPILTERRFIARSFRFLEGILDLPNQWPVCTQTLMAQPLKNTTDGNAGTKNLRRALDPKTTR